MQSMRADQAQRQASQQVRGFTEAAVSLTNEDVRHIHAAQRDIAVKEQRVRQEAASYSANLQRLSGLVDTVQGGLKEVLAR
jgi:hypothetical protein